MATIAKMAVLLTADTRQFEAKTLSASGKLGALRASFNRATDSARAWKSLTGSVGGFKLAGRETLDSFRTTLAVARSELRRFGRNRDATAQPDRRSVPVFRRATGATEEADAHGGVGQKAA